MDVSLDRQAANGQDERDAEDLPFSVYLELTVKDTETIAELCNYPEGEPREEFALRALRVGTMALRQARGQIDADVIRRESQRLLDGMQSRLEGHSRQMSQSLTGALKEYFDPRDGRFHERLQRLVDRDGELEQVLRRQIGREDSELCKTLSAHFGDDSPLMKLLSPQESKGLLGALRTTLEEQLKAQREAVLGQFSLDNREGALARFIGELTERHGKLSAQLCDKVDEAVRQFSLDEENSALSRLVRNVDRAQRTITREFSLDEETSALSRLSRLLDNTNNAIHSHLSLDEENSALARLKREMLTLLRDHGKANQEFQEEVKGALRELTARRQEAARSTRHGVVFEDAVFELTQMEAQRAGDIADRTGARTGRIPNCKVGDCVVELGPENSAGGARLAIEAKEKREYDLPRALEEIEQARKNRDAQVGLFVFSRKTAPAGLEPLARYGSDIVVIWDAEAPETDIFLRVGLTLGRALCVRGRKARENQSADFSAIDDAILRVEKQVRYFDDIDKWANTIRNNSEKILQKSKTMRGALLKALQVLQEKTHDLRGALAEADEG